MLKSSWEWLLLLSLGCPGDPVRPDYGWFKIFFNCLLYQSTLQVILQRKGTVAVHCWLSTGISPHCCSVNDLRGGREKQSCLYVFYLSAESFGKGRLGWECFIFPPLCPGGLPRCNLQAEQPQPVSMGEMLQILIIFVVLLWTHLNRSTSPILDVSELNAGLQNS